MYFIRLMQVKKVEKIEDTFNGYWFIVDEKKKSVIVRMGINWTASTEDKLKVNELIKILSYH